MIVTVCRRDKFKFEACHHLRGVVPPGHKCERLHGHSYKVELKITGHLENGMVCGLEFDEIDAAVQGLVDKLDHQTLNELDLGGDPPTIENLVIWFALEIKKMLPRAQDIGVRLHEGPRSWAEVSV